MFVDLFNDRKTGYSRYKPLKVSLLNPYHMSRKRAITKNHNTILTELGIEKETMIHIKYGSRFDRNEFHWILYTDETLFDPKEAAKLEALPQFVKRIKRAGHADVWLFDLDDSKQSDPLEHDRLFYDYFASHRRVKNIIGAWIAPKNSQVILPEPLEIPAKIPLGIDGVGKLISLVPKNKK
jgi:hypothetical protein